MTSNFSRSLATRITSLAAVAAVAAFLFGCAQPTQTPVSSTRISSYLPVAHGSGNSRSIVDIPTPSFTGNAITAGTLSGHKVCLTWQSNSPDNTTFDYSTGTDPVANSLNGSYGWEYWGCTQNSIVSSPSYSGHYELRRINPDNSETSLGDITADSYCDDNLADGTYTYYLKAKSREGSSPNQMTHHSEESEGYAVTVTSCQQDGSGSVNATIASVAVGTGSWSGTSVPTDGSSAWSEAATWTKSSGGNGYNIAFNIGQYTWTHNTCTGYDYTYSNDYHGALWVSINGTTWVQPVQWSAGTHEYYQINSGGGGTHGFGALANGTYTVRFSTTNNISGLLGTFTMVVQ